MFMGNGRALFHLRCREDLVGHRGVSGYYGADCGLLVRGFREARMGQFHGCIGLFGAVGGLMATVGSFWLRIGPFGAVGGLWVVSIIESSGRAPELPRFILLVSFSDTLLVVSILDIVCDCYF